MILLPDPVFPKGLSVLTARAHNPKVVGVQVAVTKPLTSDGFVSRRELNRIVGFKPKCVLRSIGKLGAGHSMVQTPRGFLFGFSRPLTDQLQRLIDDALGLR